MVIVKFVDIIIQYTYHTSCYIRLMRQEEGEDIIRSIQTIRRVQTFHENGEIMTGNGLIWEFRGTETRRSNSLLGDYHFSKVPT